MLFRSKSKELSQTQLRKLAPKTYLSYPKMREWRDLVRQLTDLSKRLGLDIESDNGGPDALHRALLTGLLARIGHLDPETNDYRGAHALRFALHPSSVLGKRRSSARPPRQSGNKVLGQSGNSPEWIVAGELVDTSRLFARNAAEIDVRWIEPLAGDIAKHSYRSPEWDAENGFVRAIEQVTLYGLVIVPARRRDYSRIDPALSRQMFLLHALAMGEFPHPPPSVRENAALIGEIKKRAERLRRPELFDANALVQHFDEAVPREIVSTRDLVKWLRVATDEEKSRFRLDKRQWLPKVGVSSAAFPDSIRIGGVKLALSYRHTPDDPERDGITCTVRKSDAAVLKLWSADWLVPGALPEKLAFLLGVLPSSLRRVVSPISDTVAIIAPLLSPGEKPLVDAVREVLKTHNGIAIPSAAWENVKYPPHLLVRYRIKDEDGKILAETRDLDAALAAAGVGGRSASASSPHNDEKHADWDFGTIAEKQTDSSAGWTLTNYPALSDEGDGVRIKLFKSADDAARAHEAGVVRLFFLRLTKHARPSFATNRLPLSAGLYLGTIGYERSRIADDLLWAAIRKGAVEGLAPIRSKEDFETRLRERRGAIDAARAELSVLFSSILKSAAGCAERLETAAPAEDIYDAVETQLAWLVFPGFLKAVPPERLKHYDRYLRGVRVRIDRARSNPSGDRDEGIARRALLGALPRGDSRQRVKDRQPRRVCGVPLDGRGVSRFRLRAGSPRGDSGKRKAPRREMGRGAW